MEFQLLGPVEARHDGELVDLGPPRQRCVLAALAVDVGRPVLLPTLVDRVWDEDPPQRARETVYVYIGRLRRILTDAVGGSALLERRSKGYVLDAEPGQVDLHRYRRALDEARQPACPPVRRLELLRGALAAWHGTPLADLDGEWAARLRTGLEREHIRTVTDWAGEEIRAGNYAGPLGALADLLDRDPLNEALAAELIRGLHRAGRTAEALDSYRRIRDRLVEELGVEPGPDLREMHRTVLRGDLEPAAGPPDAAPDGGTGPAQLPLDVAGFTGRARELSSLTALLTSAARQPTAATVCVLSGTAGVGKTALAVHFAHRVRDRFPDGQLYVNLRGFDPSSHAVPPDEAVRAFLEALDVPPSRVPRTAEAQFALYRTLLADKRMIVLLDNASDVGQVRPLLPGAPGCLVLITSRIQLLTLVAAEGARPVPVDVLPRDDAEALLSSRLGDGWAGDEPDAVDAVIERCAGLPLALAIVAARAATLPGTSLRGLAEELAGERTQLDGLSTGDDATDVRAVFSWSYRTLSPAAATLFRLLGLHPGPDVSLAALASLVGDRIGDVRRPLAELVHAHLVDQRTVGRYRLHDLLHAYAAELAASLDGEQDRVLAGRRIIDHYLHTAHAADRLMHPSRDLVALPAAAPGVRAEPIGSGEAAIAWFTAEHQVLIAAVRWAHAAGDAARTWHLAWRLATYFDWQGHWHDWVTTQEIGLAAACAAGRPLWEAHSHRGLARAATWLGRVEEAEVRFGEALRLYRILEELAGQAHTEHDLARLYSIKGHDRQAWAHAHEALILYRAAGHRSGEANALNALAWCSVMIGRAEAAVWYCERALTLLQEIGDGKGEAAAWDTLGYAYHRLGKYHEAVNGYQHSLDLQRDQGDRNQEAMTLGHLGESFLGAGDIDGARRSWQQSLDVLESLGHPDAEEARKRLRTLV